MKVINFKEFLSNPIEIDSICLGTFDGFHLGHQELIRRALLDSKGNVSVLLFSSHPAKYINKDIDELMSLDSKINFLNKLKVDYAIVIEVDKDFFSLSYEDFLCSYLDKINPKTIVVGQDFRFGKNGEGDVEILKRKYNTLVIPLLTKNNVKVSSSLIRSLLKEGEIEQANEYLGHPYEICGKVIEGLHNGRKIGFPTANLEISIEGSILKRGVYASIAYVLGIPYKAMVNIGTHPTISTLTKPIIEVHILNFSSSLYNKTIYVDFISFLREEKKFDSLKELKDQLEIDNKKVEEILNF